MRNSTLSLIVLFSLVAVASSAADCLPTNSQNDAFGFSSEDWGGGGSSYLGVDTRDITPDRLSALHLKEERGVEVTMVDQDAPAGKAGVKEQDVILSVNGENVVSVEQLRRMIRETPPGRIVTLGVSRNGQPLTIKVQLSDRKRAFAYSYPDNKEFKFVMPPMPVIPDFDIPVSIVVAHSSARSGLMVENITPQLGEFFGTKDGNGVLVRSVEKGSRAEKAGLRAGDVIVKINGEAIHDTGDFSHALRSRKDNTASLGILRDKKEQTVMLTMPERKQSRVIEESKDDPEISAETELELSELRSEMAQLKPQIEEAVNREMEQIKPDIELAKREALKHKQELRKQMQEVERQLHRNQHEMERQLRLRMRESGATI